MPKGKYTAMVVPLPFRRNRFYECWKEADDYILRRAGIPKGGIWMSTPAENMKQLADWILKECPSEIGAGDLQHGESAVEIAIRLMKECFDWRQWYAGRKED